MIKQIIRTKILTVFGWKMECSLVSHVLLHQELTFAKIIIMGIDAKPVRPSPRLTIVTSSVMTQEKDGKVCSINFLKKVGPYHYFKPHEKTAKNLALAGVSPL